jgi:hypothetical protein
LGTFSLGPGTLGYVFRDRGRLVACAFAIEKDAPPIEVELPAAELLDMYGNRLAERRQRLGIEPVWMVGLVETDPVVLQTAYDLSTRLVAAAVAGDAPTIELRARNRRPGPLQATWTATAPAGWTIEPSSGQLDVAAGKEAVVPFRVHIPPQSAAGAAEVALTVREGAVEKPLATRFLLVPAAQLAAEPLRGPPGRARLAVRLKNHSSTAKSFVLKAEVPAGWKATPAESSLVDIPGGQTREAEFQVDWTGRWEPADKARVVALTADGKPVAEAGIVPGQIGIARLGQITFDGDLADWPAATRLPRWALGREGPPAEAEVYLGYLPEGLCFAVKAEGSGFEVSDPRAFWSQHCLEVFLDTKNDRSPRTQYAATDHQFWFCPLVAESRVYAGRWKRNQEIPETLFDLPGVRSGCKRAGDGYAMEVLLPAALVRGFAPEPGRKLGLNLNLTIPGRDGQGELCWPTSKPAGAPTSPQLWGTAELR